MVDPRLSGRLRKGRLRSALQRRKDSRLRRCPPIWATISMPGSLAIKERRRIPNWRGRRLHPSSGQVLLRSRDHRIGALRVVMCRVAALAVVTAAETMAAAPGRAVTAEGGTAGVDTA